MLSALPLMRRIFVFQKPKTKAGLASLSTGEKVPGPKPRKELLVRLRRHSRSLPRKMKGAANRRKAKNKLAELHARIAAVRLDALRKLATSLAQRFGIIGIEDLNVRGMAKSRHLARCIADMGFVEFRRQLECKAASLRKSRGCGQVFCQFKDLFQLRISLRRWCFPCGSGTARPVEPGMTATSMPQST